ncbi:MAG: hypothetical protein HC945_02245 [Nitrosarchaeum sp.]|nr:hypothetical protein [Nitrosarchaeum sp.]
MVRIQEGKVAIELPEQGAATRKLEVFHNQRMALARDLLIALLRARGVRGLRVCDPLAGSGVRALRLLVEASDVVQQVLVGDSSSRAVACARRNALELGVADRMLFFEEDARVLLAREDNCDVVDIDPFGSPNPFLDAAVQALRPEGLLCVTATDTAALAGAYPRTCVRKYWARPLRGAYEHEAGLRILVRKVQLVGAQHGRALMPVMAYAREHYYRAVFSSVKLRKAAEEVALGFGFLSVLASGEVCLGRDLCGVSAGPLWVGPLGDAGELCRMVPLLEGEAREVCALLAEESFEGVLYCVHQLCKALGVPKVPRLEAVLACLRGRGVRAERSHVGPTMLRTDASFELVRSCFENLKR